MQTCYETLTLKFQGLFLGLAKLRGYIVFPFRVWCALDNNEGLSVRDSERERENERVG
jgi:hypothetical protein